MKSKPTSLLGRLVRAIFDSAPRSTPSVIALDIEVDSTQLRETLALLEQITTAAEKAEATMGAVGVTPLCELAAAEFAPETPLLAALQELLCEIRADRQERSAAMAEGRKLAGAVSPVSKSALEGEMQRRGVLRDMPPGTA